MDDKNGKFCFFKKIFLLADISMNITFKMAFLTLSNVQINFNDCELRWRSYTLIEVMFTIRRVELVRKTEFVAVALDIDNKIFIVYITSIVSLDPMHLSCQA